MAGMNLFGAPRLPVEWDYDAEVDTLYVSFGPARAAVGIDIGNGTIVRYDEAAGVVVGLTIVGIGDRVEHVLKSEPGRAAPLRSQRTP